MNIYLNLISLMILFFVSCGKNDKSSGTPETQREMQGPENGEYRAVLRSLNTSAGKHNSFGTALINLNDDKIEVRVNFIKGPHASHIQSIHTAGRCPTSDSDKNQDGIIDLIEGSKIFGKFLIPLDEDISVQENGPANYPVGKTYSYTRSSVYRDLMSNLYAPDPQSEDFVTKLKLNSPLQLDQRTIVILGVSNQVTLPATVATAQELAPEASVPIACGEIVRIIPE